MARRGSVWVQRTASGFQAMAVHGGQPAHSAQRGSDGISKCRLLPWCGKDRLENSTALPSLALGIMRHPQGPEAKQASWRYILGKPVLLGVAEQWVSERIDGVAARDGPRSISGGLPCDLRSSGSLGAPCLVDIDGWIAQAQRLQQVAARRCGA